MARALFSAIMPNKMQNGHITSSQNERRCLCSNTPFDSSCPDCTHDTSIKRWMGALIKNLRVLPRTIYCGTRTAHVLATHLGLQITVDHVEAVQIGEGKHYLRGIELALVVGKSVYWVVKAAKETPESDTSRCSAVEVYISG